MGQVWESIAVHNGLGRHCSALTHNQLVQAVKWFDSNVQTPITPDSFKDVH